MDLSIIKNDNINDVEEVGMDPLIQVMQADHSSYGSVHTLFDYYADHFMKEVLEKQNEIFESKEEDFKLASFTAITHLYTALSQLLEKNGTEMQAFLAHIHFEHNPLMLACKLGEEDKKSFVQNIVSHMKEWEQGGKSVLNELQDFRMSEEGRRAIKSKRHAMDNAIIEELLQEYSTAAKAEILARIEKYVESGWFEKDNPLKEYYDSDIDDPLSRQKAVASLKKAMGERFFAVRIQEVITGTQVDYELVIQKDNKLGKAVFDIATHGIKDLAIDSVDGSTLFISDITTQETGYNNNNSNLKTSIACKNYQEDHPNEKIDISIYFMSLFNDDNHQLKKSFIEKNQAFNDQTVADWHLIRFVAVLDRDHHNFKYGTYNTLKGLQLKHFGSRSESLNNQFLMQDEPSFIASLMTVIHRTLDNIKPEMALNAKGMETNVESVPIHLLTAAIKGMEKLVAHDDKLVHDYCQLKNKIKGLSKQIVEHGHIRTELRNLADRMDSPQRIREGYEEDKLDYFSRQDAIERKRVEQARFVQDNEQQVKQLALHIQAFSQSTYDKVLPLVKMQSQLWSRNYQEPLSGVKAQIDNIMGHKTLNFVDYNRQTIGKQDDFIKRFIISATGAVNASHTPSELIDHFKRVMERLRDDPELQGDAVPMSNKLKSFKIKNAQGKPTVYGLLLRELKKAEVSSKEEGEALFKKYITDLKDHIKTQSEMILNAIADLEALKETQKLTQGLKV